jgi:type II secretory pathway pseudopilin PulG
MNHIFDKEITEEASGWIGPATIISIIGFILSVAISSYAGYTHNDKDLSNRMTAVEVQQKNDKEAAAEMKTDIRDIKKDVSDLVKWALGNRQ